jgi:hypothetical protein
MPISQRQALEALAIDQQSMITFQHRDQSARSQTGVAQAFMPGIFFGFLLDC